MLRHEIILLFLCFYSPKGRAHYVGEDRPMRCPFITCDVATDPCCSDPYRRRCGGHQPADGCELSDRSTGSWLGNQSGRRVLRVDAETMDFSASTVLFWTQKSCKKTGIDLYWQPYQGRQLVIQDTIVHMQPCERFGTCETRETVVSSVYSYIIVTNSIYI